ncbi:MAG TPA: energy transducer TonB, partial [Gammaproteobacteria bacterium]
SHWALLVTLSSLAAIPARAEWRCDCTTITDSCRADVTIQGSWVEVSSDRQECSRVDYFIDGLPFVAVVVGGVQRQDWIARTEGSQVLVQSCQVCRDNAGADTPGPAATPPAAARAPTSALTPIIKVVPEYPESARLQGIEGRVELNFTVNSSGAVESPTVTASSPTGVFDRAALAAISRWRYAPVAQDAPARNASEVLVFALEGNTRGDERGRASVNNGGPRNECVRENSVYNYGDVVDVELINACADPLLVYSCAAGTGRHADRWVCASLEEAARVLVAPGDVRVGMPVNDTAAGRGVFELTDRYLITRAPNTQYWWVACGSADTACRENARLWMRSLNQQSADVDPQARSSLAIGRSY